jgi:hypothetical protein
MCPTGYTKNQGQEAAAIFRVTSGPRVAISEVERARINQVTLFNMSLPPWGKLTLPFRKTEGPSNGLHPLGPSKGLHPWWSKLVIRRVENYSWVYLYNLLQKIIWLQNWQNKK